MSTIVSYRKSRTRHQPREAYSFRRAAQQAPGSAAATVPPAAPGEEIHQLREQILGLRTTIVEQEETIAFLRDLLTQRWFDDAEQPARQ